MQSIVHINSWFAEGNNLLSLVSLCFRNKWGVFIKWEKEKTDFPAEKWAKYCWTANIWYHLSLVWTGKKKKKKDYTRGSNPVFARKRRWHGRPFQWLKTFHFHIASVQIEHLSSLSVCISLSSVQTLETKMLEFCFPRERCWVKIPQSFQPFSKQPHRLP